MSRKAFRRLLYDSWTCGTFASWCPYSLWRTALTSAVALTKTLPQSSEHISAYLTSTTLFTQCEFPCISTNSNTTGTEGEKRAAVLVVCTVLSTPQTRFISITPDYNIRRRSTSLKPNVSAHAVYSIFN